MSPSWAAGRVASTPPGSSSGPILAARSMCTSRGCPARRSVSGSGSAAGTQRNLRAADAPTLDGILQPGVAARHEHAGRRPGRTPAEHTPARDRPGHAADRAQQHAAERGGRPALRRPGDGGRRRCRSGSSRPTGSAAPPGPPGRPARRRHRHRHRPVPVVRHRLRPGQRDLRARHHQPRHLRHPRLPVRGRPQHVPDRDRRAGPGGAPDSTPRADATPFEESDQRFAGLPAGGLPRAAARPRADRQPHPLAALPHRPLRPLASWPAGAPRRRRPHRALLHRVRDQLAVEDAIALVAALRTSASLEQALRTYAAERRRPSSISRPSRPAANAGGIRSPSGCTFP